MQFRLNPLTLIKMKQIREAGNENGLVLDAEIIPKLSH